jgi:superfamily II DNA or RNA helicase
VAANSSERIINPPTDVASESEQLRIENQRLRALLGLNSRPSDVHSEAWAPTLFNQARQQTKIDKTAPIEEKVALLRSLFGSRSEVFAVRWESSSSGKSGWSPAIRGGWAQKGVKKDYLPLTDDVFADHLVGTATVGIYPMMPGDVCCLLACDFDDGAWALDALAYLDACHRSGVPAALERSRSGDGAHVWVFFASPVSAVTARSLGTSLLREAMSTRGELDLSSYDRLFPSQDFMPKGSFGNLIALPLQGERLAHDTTAFLDPSTMAPWPDQWEFLSSVARLDPDAATSLAASLKTANAGPELTLADLKHTEGPQPPPVIRARLGATLAIERSGLPPALVAGLKHFGSISNPVFYEKQRMRFSTWDTPRFIRCYSEDLEWLYLPRGIVETVTGLINELGSDLEITDSRPEHAAAGFKFLGTLRPHQLKAVSKVIAHERGVIVAPPGAGKTVMACAVMAHHDTPTLVLVDRKPLLDQWRERLAENLGLDVKDIGVIGGGVNKPTGRVDVAMIQSVARTEQPGDLFARYGLVVVDECHHVPAVSFELCVRDAPTRRWLGLTATPYRRDGLQAIIAMQCGSIRYESSTEEWTDSAQVHRQLIVHETHTEASDLDAKSIQDIFTAVIDDQVRTSQICDDVHIATSSGRTCLVLTQRTDHIDSIVETLVALGDRPLVLRGGMGKKARLAVLDKLAARTLGSGVVLVATGSYLGEGFDWPELDTLFLAFPLAFKGRVVQYVGRLLRSHNDKHGVELHDYVETCIPVLDRMHSKRLNVYRTLGFDVPKNRRNREDSG